MTLEASREGTKNPPDTSHQTPHLPPAQGHPPALTQACPGRRWHRCCPWSASTGTCPPTSCAALAGCPGRRERCAWEKNTHTHTQKEFSRATSFFYCPAGLWQGPGRQPRQCQDNKRLIYRYKVKRSVVGLSSSPTYSFPHLSSPCWGWLLCAAWEGDFSLLAGFG